MFGESPNPWRPAWRAIKKLTFCTSSTADEALSVEEMRKMHF